MEDLLKLLRFEIYGEEMSYYTLENYIDMMKEGQNKIYYICGNEIPILYMYKEKVYKVIYFKDCIDEFMMQRVLKYKEYEFINSLHVDGEIYIYNLQNTNLVGKSLKNRVS